MMTSSMNVSLNSLSLNSLSLNSRGGGYWSDYPESYRAEQVATIAQWLAVGNSGVVVGGGGSGKSNLVGFMASRPEVVCQHLSDEPEDYAFLHFDINSLPTVTTPYFYRGLLYAMQNAAAQFSPEAATAIAQLNTNIPNSEDALALYFALHQAHDLLINQVGKKVVWFIDRFDAACARLEAGTLSSLRNLRDNHQFRGKLSYILFTRHPLDRLRNPAEFDEFHEIMVSNICWVGPMVPRDGQWIARQMADRHAAHFTEMETASLLQVTGGLPGFMKAACEALIEQKIQPKQPMQEWVGTLLNLPNLTRFCEEMWQDCTDAEQTVLSAIAMGLHHAGLDTETVDFLANAGLLTQKQGQATGRMCIFSPIFAQFVTQQQTQAAIGISVQARTGLILRGGVPLEEELTPLEHRLLTYFVDHSGEICEKDALMIHIWPDEEVQAGIRDDRLAQLVKRLRSKIEMDEIQHIFIHTVRGRGFRFEQPEEG